MSLIVHIGPVGSGKTSSMVRAARAYQGPVYAIRPSLDTRSCPGALSTHDDQFYPCEICPTIDYMLGRRPSPGALLLIDEVQLFPSPNLVRDLIEYVLRQGRFARVEVAGCDFYWTGEPWHPMDDLCAMVGVVQHTAPCAVCGELARYSWRKSGSGELVQIGGTAQYEARCRAHHPRLCGKVEV